MDSLVTQSQSELLLWPKETRPELKDMVVRRSLVDSKYNINPYEIGEYAEIGSDAFTYYNADETVKWSVSSTALGYTLSAPSGSEPFFTATHVYNVVYDYPNYRIAKFDVNTGSFTVGAVIPKPADSPVWGAFTYQGGDLILSQWNWQNTDIYNTHRINLDTLAVTEIQNDLFTVPHRSNGYAIRKGAVSLFNGSALLFEASKDRGTQSLEGINNASAVVFGINRSLLFDDVDSKVRIDTAHSFSLEMFNGEITQISPDVFICGTKSAIGYPPRAPSYLPKVVTLAELEKWASDCIFKATGIQIPLSEVV